MDGGSELESAAQQTTPQTEQSEPKTVPKTPYQQFLADAEADDKTKIVGGEIISPTAVRVPNQEKGETPDQVRREAEIGGWLAAITGAKDRPGDIQAIINEAKAAGVSKEVLRTHLESLGIKVTQAENAKAAPESKEGKTIPAPVEQSQPAKQTEQKQSFKSVKTEGLKLINSKEEVAQKISEQIKGQQGLSQDELERRHQQLAAKPALSSRELMATMNGRSETAAFAWVSTDKIVGKSFLQPGGWAYEIDSRKGRIITVAQEILQSGQDPNEIDHVFHPQDPPQRIQLTEIPGPAGPIYLVDDGTHRVSGAIVAGLSEIPANIKEIQYPVQQNTVNAGEAEKWQMYIDRGAIDGTISEQNQNGKKVYTLMVRNEVCPWIRAPQPDMIKISEVYDKLYPGSLDKLKIPREALLDPIANNFYLAGKWDEWATKYCQNKQS